MHVLGIDAGGTKTVCLLADARGAIVSEARGSGANLRTSGEAAVDRVLRAVVHETLDGRAIEPAAICIGMAGVDREDETRAVHAIMQRVAPRSRILVVNDALIALAAGAGDEPGIVIIAGTGSIAFGRNARDEAARAGGWGHMIGDEGSGYWIGREALAAVMRSCDGRAPATALTAAILRHFNVADISQLPRIVYDREQPRRSVSALGPVVQQASDSGDAIARQILDRAVDELALMARTVAERLDMRGEKFTFYLAGGAFRVVPRLAQEMPRRLVRMAPRTTSALLQEEPARGAVWLALAEARGASRVPGYK
jgi:N-acetylglucosamine kinase-like BadF-type ATPase